MDRLLRWYFRIRQKRLEQVHRDPFAYQEMILQRILRTNRDTWFGRKYAFREIHNYLQFNQHVPAGTYETLYPLIARMMSGEERDLTRHNVDWFAKSSGTSTGRSKYIPVTGAYLKQNHLACAWDAASVIYNQDPKAGLFRHKSVIMGGSLEDLGNGKMAGDISAVIIKHFPAIGRRFYTPDFETALMSDWEKKIKEIARITQNEPVTLLAGVPTWTLVLLRELLTQTGKKNISQVWPGLRSYLHGGVHFEPYRQTFEQLIPSGNVVYREVFNASEGYYAIQDDYRFDGMMLLCDRDIFYEFIPAEQMDAPDPEIIPLSKVEAGKSYVLVITNGSGLYRYNTGDIVHFRSVLPYRLKVEGRTAQQINAFGEEVSIHNATQALSAICRMHGAEIEEFTVAPVYLTGKQKGKHQWLIEFRKEPVDMAVFARDLDKQLRKLNSDYDAKRTSDLAVENLEVEVMRPGTFVKWYRKHGKYGGQNKMPRLRNDRELAEELIALQGYSLSGVSE